MKYLVNRETKEHVKYDSVPPEFNINGWKIVEADAEGWIKWDDGECPLPDDCFCDVRLGVLNEEVKGGRASVWTWSRKIGVIPITQYRPILDKPFVSKTDESPVPEQQCNDLLTRLKSAHEAAQAIPDLLAELREVLGSMGYDVVARSPFADRTDSDSDIVEPESGTQYKNPKEVPTSALIARLNELADAVAKGPDSVRREFTMRIPAECDRDADLVISEAARRLAALESQAARCPYIETSGTTSWCRLAAQPKVPESLDPYDSGYFSDFGGGNVGWWHDYIRSELDRAHDFYQSQLTASQEQPK